MMPQEISDGNEERFESSPQTDSLIRDAYLASATKRVILNASYLDDEKLSENERVAVLREVFHRNIRVRQLQRLARFLSPVLGSELPSNLLIYGPTGTGKSVTCLHFLATLSSICTEKKVGFAYYYLDLTTPKTCFSALNELAIALQPNTKRYRKGIPLDQMCQAIIRALDHLRGLVCILIDEVDNVTVDSDAFYTFLAKTLPRKVRPRIFYLFLTNRLEWEKTLDPRILSVLKKTDLIFEPYDAMDLVKILNLRVQKALRPGKVDPGAIRKIAAYASRETGDARKAIELLVKAVRIAEESSGLLGEKEVDEADRMLEVDKTEALINALATQQRLALLACYTGLRTQTRKLSTGHAYQVYQEICSREGSRALTQRRFSDMVSFLDLYGLINARVISKGRYGKTRELTGSLPDHMVGRLLGRGGLQAYLE